MACAYPSEPNLVKYWRFALFSDEKMAEPETKKVKVVADAEGGASSSTKKAIITGITGQDGSYLAEFLLEKVR